jgi:DNA invertase Pin-like site-specific DNA recombinase
MASKFVAYYRVSTQQQGRSGLGLDAQKRAVSGYLGERASGLIGEFVEVETGKGANALDRRPQLREALVLCKKRGGVLVIAKLDRLARNVHFVTGLIESGVEFVATDMPFANKTMIQIHAVMAEHERDQIAARTKAALAAAKARGVKLGQTWRENFRVKARQTAAGDFAEKLRGQVQGFKLRGLTRREMVEELNALGIPAPRGGRWGLCAVQRLVARLEGVI